MSEGAQSVASMGNAVSTSVSTQSMSSMESGMARTEGVKAPIASPIGDRGERTLQRGQGVKVADMLVVTVKSDGIHEAMENLEKGVHINPTTEGIPKSKDMEREVKDEGMRKEIDTHDLVPPVVESPDNSPHDTNSTDITQGSEYKKIWGDLYAEARANGDEIDMGALDKKAEEIYKILKEKKSNTEDTPREEGVENQSLSFDHDSVERKNQDGELVNNSLDVDTLMQEAWKRLETEEMSPDVKKVFDSVKSTMYAELQKKKREKEDEENGSVDVLMVLMMTLMLMLGPVLNVAKER